VFNVAKNFSEIICTIKKSKRILSVFLVFALLLVIVPAGLLKASAAAVPGFEIFQNFESGSPAFKAPTVSNGATPDTVSLDTAAPISGGQSLKIVSAQNPGEDSRSSIINLIENAPAPTLNPYNGIFFRLDTNTTSDTFLKGIFTPVPNYMPYLTLVSVTGAVTHNIKDGRIPAGFSGYVFIRAGSPDGVANLNKAVPFFASSLSIEFTGPWGNSVTYIDNVGFFNVQLNDELTYDATSVEFRSIVNQIEWRNPSGVSAFSNFQDFETVDARANSGQLGGHPANGTVEYVDLADGALVGNYSMKITPPTSERTVKLKES